MSPRIRRYALALAVVVLMIAVAASQKQAEPPRHLFRITLGLKDKKATDWSGQVAIEGGEVTALTGRRLEGMDAIDGVRAALPQLQAALPGDVDVWVASDRSSTIRSSLIDTQRTLLIAVGLVILVVFAFLRNGRATLIPSVAVPISIIGTFGVMYLCGYKLDNHSLMALTISTGFVVDDAIVVMENI